MRYLQEEIRYGHLGIYKEFDSFSCQKVNKELLFWHIDLFHHVGRMFDIFAIAKNA